MKKSELCTLILGVVLAGCAVDATMDNQADASASRQPQCRIDDDDCHGGGHGGHTGSGGGSSFPPAQQKPPAPSANPHLFDYNAAAFDFDAGLLIALGAPPPPNDPPWPLGASPYTPEVTGAPVSVRNVENNLWAYVSLDSDGFASNCIGDCTSDPTEPFNINTGTYQATLTMTARLDVELWNVVQQQVLFTTIPRANRVAEITATVYVRAFAECVGWESGSGKLHALIGTGNLTLERDTGILEDIYDFFVPGFTASQNNQIRQRLMEQMQIGQYSALPINGDPCATLGVSGDATTGAILWDPPRPAFWNGALDTKVTALPLIQ